MNDTSSSYRPARPTNVLRQRAPFAPSARLRGARYYLGVCRYGHKSPALVHPLGPLPMVAFPPDGSLEPGHFSNLDRVAAVSPTRTSSHPQAQGDRQQPRKHARQRWSWAAFAAASLTVPRVVAAGIIGATIPHDWAKTAPPGLAGFL